MNDEERRSSIYGLKGIINWLEDHVAKQEDFKDFAEKETELKKDLNAANLKINNTVANMDGDRAALHESLNGLISVLKNDVSFLEHGNVETATILVAATTPTDTDDEFSTSFAEMVNSTGEQELVRENTLDYLDKVIELSGYEVVSEDDKELIFSISASIAELKSTLYGSQSATDV